MAKTSEVAAPAAVPSSADIDRAAKFARDSLAGAGLTNAEVAIRDVGVWLEDVKRHDLSRLSKESAAALQNDIDLVLLDPPRVGAESRVIAGVLGYRRALKGFVGDVPETIEAGDRLHL